MSAIAASGYPDWQRLTNWDGPILWTLNNGVYNATQTSPLMRVDRYHALGGFMQLSAGACHIFIAWYADAAGTVLLGARDFYMDGGFANPTQFRLVNLGAWCQVRLTPIGASFTVTTPVQIAPTNRSFPAETTPDTNPLGRGTVGGLVAGGIQAFNVGSFMLGRAHLWMQTSTAQSSAGINYFQNNGTYITLLEAHADANGYVNVDFIMPTSSIQMYVVNFSAAAATFNCSVSATGGA